MDEECTSVFQACREQLVYASFYGVVIDFRVVKSVSEKGLQELKELKDALFKKTRYILVSGLSEDLKKQLIDCSFTYDYEIVKRIKDGIVNINKLQAPLEE